MDTPRSLLWGCPTRTPPPRGRRTSRPVSRQDTTATAKPVNAPPDGSQDTPPPAPLGPGTDQQEHLTARDSLPSAQCGRHTGRPGLALWLDTGALYIFMAAPPPPHATQSTPRGPKPLLGNKQIQSWPNSHHGGAARPLEAPEPGPFMLHRGTGSRHTTGCVLTRSEPGSLHRRPERSDPRGQKRDGVVPKSPTNAALLTGQEVRHTRGFEELMLMKWRFPAAPPPPPTAPCF